MKKHRKLILGALVVYLLLLLLLLAVESGQPGASIRTFGDVLWYSLITITTVGYGDMAPVTAFGRALGLVFALCSIGLFTALIGVGLRLIGGEFIPKLRLRRSRERRWYAFTEVNGDTLALSRAIRQRQLERQLEAHLSPETAEALQKALEEIRAREEATVQRE